MAIRFHDSKGLMIACGILTLFGTVAGIFFLQLLPKRHNQITRTFRDVQWAGGEVAGYAATYLLPFVTVSAPSPYDVAGYILFFSVMGLIYIRSNMLQVNPFIYLVGKKVFSVRLGDTLCYVIGNDKQMATMPLTVVEIDKNLYIARY